MGGWAVGVRVRALYLAPSRALPWILAAIANLSTVLTSPGTLHNKLIETLKLEHLQYEIKNMDSKSPKSSF